MAIKNITNLQVYGRRTKPIAQFIHYLENAPLFNGEALLISECSADINAFCRAYKQEHGEITSIIINEKKEKTGFYYVWRDSSNLYVETIKNEKL